MNINTVWAKIIKYQNEIFITKRGIPYTYSVEEKYVVINDDCRRKISKDYFEKALLIENPTPQKIQSEGIWGPSYIYGIITDERISSI